MADRLEVIKDLRAKGASIRMIDDVAAHLQEFGGYDTPVLIATVEFILKIRDMLRSVLQQHEQSMELTSEFGEKEFKETENVNFDAAKAGVTNDEEIEENERLKIFDIIEVLKAQREAYIEEKQVHDPETDGNKKKKSSSRRGNSLLERLFKITAAMLAGKQQKERLQSQVENAHGAARQNAGQRMQQSQVSQRSSLLKMNLLKMRLLNGLRSSSKTVIEDASSQARRSSRQFNKSASQQPAVENKSATRRDNRTGVRAFLAKFQARQHALQDHHDHHDYHHDQHDHHPEIKVVSRKDKQMVESSISEVIDKAVKSKRAEQKPAEQKPAEKIEQRVALQKATEKPADKGRFERQAAEKSGPRADDKKVAEMTAKAAIKTLKDMGVTAASHDAAGKKEIDVQVAQAKAGTGGATPKLQR